MLADHEETIVELCSNPGKSDIEVDECVTDFLREGYYSEKNGAEEPNDDAENEDDNNDNMLDNLFNMWAEDLPVAPVAPTETVDPAANQKAKPKPWSSRSSPSGTFVRDPRTGKMKNIDA